MSIRASDVNNGARWNGVSDGGAFTGAGYGRQFPGRRPPAHGAALVHGARSQAPGNMEETDRIRNDEPGLCRPGMSERGDQLIRRDDRRLAREDLLHETGMDFRIGVGAAILHDDAEVIGVGGVP